MAEQGRPGRYGARVPTDPPPAPAAGAASEIPASAPAGSDGGELVEHNLTVTLASGEAASASGRGEREPALLPIHTVVGRYIILGHLGSGGMGVVYKAYDPDLNRQIALKLVRLAKADGDPQGSRGRLLREAQGLAQLSHPNVVAVYDVGLFADGVFLAMELVSGPTLRAWLGTAPKPSYRDKLRAFIAAGEGLAAAHRAGLAHRDVKPDNMILGDDGRPRVLDFGLVRSVSAGFEAAGPEAPSVIEREALGAALEASAASLSQASVGPHSDSGRSPGATLSDASGELGAPLTRAGAVLGTPRYMSPEQFLGREVDAKSDQFSFCVALYEALYGKPPFRGKTLQILRDNICRGRVRSPPAGARVPAPIRRAILKGLAPKADNRHGSMAELLAQLRRDPAAKRRRFAFSLAATLAVGVAAVAFARRGAAVERCPVDEDTPRALWSPAAAGAIGTAFAATGRPYAGDTAARVGEALNQRAAAWSAMQKQSCEATWIKGIQSETLLDLRTACLAERRAEQVTLVELLARPDQDGSAVDRAVSAVQGLRPIADCADTAALRSSHVPPPPGAADKVAELREQLAEARARRLAGGYRDAVEDSASLVAAARALDYAALYGEASFEYGEALSGVAQFEAAQEAFEQAMQAAGAAGDHHTAARAAVFWLYVVGSALDRADEALLALPMARTLAAQVGDHVLIQVWLHNAVGTLFGTAGDLEAAKTEFRQALAVLADNRVEGHVMAPRLHHNIGEALLLQDQVDDAIPELMKARDLKRDLLGPDHPDVAITLKRLAYAQSLAENHEQALSVYLEALRSLERGFGPAHVHVADLLVSMADCHRALGDLSSAARTAERSLRIHQDQLGPEHPSTGGSARLLAGIRLEQAEPAAAVALYRRSLVAYEPAHPDLVGALLGLAHALTALGSDREALAALERAVAIASEHDPGSAPDALAALARASWRTGRPRARALADRALAAFAAAGRQDERDELAAWIAAQR